MAIQSTDFLVVNRAGIDYKSPASDLTTIIGGEVGNGTITIKDSSGNTVGSFTVNQTGDTDITLPAIPVPPALNAKGFVDVAGAPPADPAYGDLYQQKSGAGNDEEVAIAGWTGIEGETVKEAQYILFASDDQWHIGSQSDSTQVQSNWNETDAASAAFILNKPDIIEEAPDDGNLYTRDGKNSSWVRGIPYDITTLPPLT